MSVVTGDEVAVVGEPASQPHQAAVIGEPPDNMAPVLGEPVLLANGLRSDQLPISATSPNDESAINGIREENATAPESRDLPTFSATSNVDEPALPEEPRDEEDIHRSAAAAAAPSSNAESQERNSGVTSEDIPADVEISHISEPPPPPPLPEIPTDNPFSVLDEVSRETDVKLSDDFEGPAAARIRYDDGDQVFATSFSTSNVEKPVASEEDITANVEVTRVSDHPPPSPPPETEIPMDNPYSVLDQVSQEMFAKSSDDFKESAASNINYEDGDPVVFTSRATSNVEKPSTPEEEIPADVEVTHISESPPLPPESEVRIDNPFSVLEEVSQEIDVKSADDFEGPAASSIRYEDDDQPVSSSDTTSSVKELVAPEEVIPKDVEVKHIKDPPQPPPESKVLTNNPFSVLEQVPQETDGKLPDDLDGLATSNISHQDRNQSVSGEEKKLATNAGKSAPDLVFSTPVAETGVGHNPTDNGVLLGVGGSAEAVPDGDVRVRENDVRNESSTRPWSTLSHANSKQTPFIKVSSEGKSIAKKSGSLFDEKLSTKNGDDYEALPDSSLKHLDSDVSVTSAPLQSSGQRSVSVEESILAEPSLDKVSPGDDGSKESKGCLPLNKEKPFVKDEKSSPFSLPVILTVVAAVLGVVAFSISRARR